MFSSRALARLAACLFVTAALSAQAPSIPLRPQPQPSTAAPTPSPEAGVPAALTAQDLNAFFDGFIPLQLERDDIAGVTISVTQNGHPLLLTLLDSPDKWHDAQVLFNWGFAQERSGGPIAAPNGPDEP